MKKLLLVILAAVCLAGCPHPTPLPPLPPPPPPPPPARALLWLDVKDINTGRGVYPCTVTISETPADIVREVDGEGHVDQDLEAGPRRVKADCPNFLPNEYTVPNAAGPDGQYMINPFTLLVKMARMPRLLVAGKFFRQEPNTPFTLIESTDFNLYARFLNNEDIEPVLRQRKEAGFNSLRVFTEYAVPGIGRLLLREHPELYARLPEFLNLVGSNGFYVNLVAYTGPYDVLGGFRPSHWTKVCEAVQGQTNVLLSLVNEVDQAANAMDQRPFSKCPNILSSRGSYGSEKWPTTPVWDWTEFHTNGAFEWHRKVGHNAMEVANVYKVPTHADENTRYPDKEQSVAKAGDAAGAASLLTAGSTFHSVNGKTSQLWVGVEWEAAKAWGEEAKSVDLTCQLGGYRHRKDLERPIDLRVYQRGTRVECIRYIGK
jgi:hypothetical protein